MTFCCFVAQLSLYPHQHGCDGKIISMYLHFLTPSHQGDAVLAYPSCKYLLDKDKVMEE